MSKNSRAPREKSTRDEEERTVYCSSFIRPWDEAPDQQIILESIPKKVEVPLPHEDNTVIPANYKYEYFLDYKEAKGPEALLEKPLDNQEIEEICNNLDEIMRNFITHLPQPKTTPKELDFVQKIWPIFRKSQYKIDILDYILYKDSLIVNVTRSNTKMSDRKFIKSLNLDVLLRLAQMYYEHFSPKYMAYVLRSHLSREEVFRFVSICDCRGTQVIEEMYPANIDKIQPPEVDNLIIEQAEDPNFRCVSILDRAIMISQKTGREINRSYIASVLSKHDYSYRQTQPVYPKIDNTGHKNTRLHVIKTLIELLKSGKEMVSVDETQLNRSLTKSHAWAKRSTRLVNTPAELGGPVHIVTAILKDRVLGYMLRNQRITCFSYKLFLMKIVQTLKEIDPNYKQRFFIFMDNATAHKKKLLKDWVEINEITVLCNAAMTPQINPIEYVFSIFKGDLKKKLHTDRERLFVYIYEAFLKINHSPDMIFNSYIHAFKFYKHILNFKSLFHKKNEFGGEKEMETNTVAIKRLKEYFETGKINGVIV